jgi:two-component system sensor histidine kinase/response regulator
LHVLLAEDNAINQLVMKRLLEKRGHRVVVVADGRQALAALDRDTFDLVFMDVQMPDMDGVEATRAIRAKELMSGGGAHQPIVALTAHAMIGDRERFLAAGMDGYLTKPIEPAAIDAILHTHVARLSAAAHRHPDPSVA